MDKTSNTRAVRVHVSTGYNRVEGNRRASRNGLVSDLPPEILSITIRCIAETRGSGSASERAGTATTRLRLYYALSTHAERGGWEERRGSGRVKVGQVGSGAGFDTFDTLKILWDSHRWRS
jgi:hypothetical protein